MKLIFFGICLLLSISGYSQKVTYAELREEDNAEMNFEILGKVGKYYVIYKSYKNNHLLTYYNDRLDFVKDVPLSKLPSKVIDVDILSYSDNIKLVYQYKEDKNIKCELIHIDENGDWVSEPKMLDMTPALSGNNRVFNMSISEDKQRILIYKMHRIGDSLHWSNRLYDTAFEVKDISTFSMPFQKDNSSVSEVMLANNGAMAFAYMTSNSRKEKVNKIIVYTKPYGIDELKAFDISGNGAYVDDVMPKVDNLNERFTFHALYAQTAKGNPVGIYTALVNFPEKQDAPIVSTIAFSNDLRKKFNSNRSMKSTFDDISLNQVVIKKNGGMILTAEENRSVRVGNRYYDRYDYLYNSPYSFRRYDYYMYNPGYYRPYYRGYPGNYYYNNYNRNEWEFQSNNILILSLSPTLNYEWDAVVTKQQRAFQSDQALSYGVLNSGGLFHFLFTVMDKNMQSIGHVAVSPSGVLSKYSNFIDRNKNKDFMPRFSKQIAYSSVIVPYQVSKRIGFALVEF